MPRSYVSWISTQMLWQTILAKTSLTIASMTKADKWTICTSHVERLNGTQRLFMKRLNRLTYAFSKKLRNLEAAFGMLAAFYNYCWRTRKPGKSGKLRATAAMMNGLADHPWSFEELFEAVLS